MGCRNHRPGEVVVRVHASGVNPLDLKIADGAAGHARVTMPAVLGIDMAGTVVEVGAAVKGFREGDEVYGMTGGVGAAPGSLAEYQADALLLAHKPRTATMAESAALPLAALVEAGSLRPRLHPLAFDLAGVARAHEALVSRTAQGKVVVTVAAPLG